MGKYFTMGKVTIEGFHLTVGGVWRTLVQAKQDMTLSIDPEGTLVLTYDGKTFESDEPVPLNTWVSIEATPEGVMWMYKGGEFPTNK